MNTNEDQQNDDNELLADAEMQAEHQDQDGGILAEEKNEEDESADEVVVTIGESEPPAEEEHKDAPEWVRELRKKNREDSRRIRELEEQLRAVKGVEKKPATVGAKPRLEEHDYDTDKYEAALAAWYEQKRVYDEEQSKAEAEAKEAEKAWQKKLADYGTAKNALKVRDFEDAEIVAQETLSTTQQGIILQGSENPALVIYALGKNPAKAKELAAIKDPVKYAFAVSKLEAQLKVTQRKAPPPERTVSGTGRISGSVDSNLERLRADAEKTGDYTKVIQYRKQLKMKNK